jgi:MOSC domain-containing protein YiiM
MTVNESSRNGRLLSVNVGPPRDISWRGETVHASVWKNPVQDRRLVRRLNVDGDGQGDLAGHGSEHRAVLVYQIDSYLWLANCYFWATTRHLALLRPKRLAGAPLCSSSQCR